MKNSGQEEFINTVKKALGKPQDESRGAVDLFSDDISAESRAILEGIQNRNAADRQKLLDTLIEAAGPINLQVMPCDDVSAVTTAITELVRHKDPEWGDQKRVVAWDHPLVERLDLPAALSGQNVPLFVTESKAFADEDIRQQVIDAYIGVTAADFCMADTATLVMRARPGQARTVSLVPAIHMAVITLDQIIADLKELYALLRWDPHERQEGLTNCLTFISGPSKTADIEATMVHGAHGPREVHLFVITS
ncbi:MAG: lactate utilization protein [Desulfobacterales bacterium]|jgi:L-lactate dehydrogenase complex protein LldG|nr:lactate utilization protein [Deltaproteobacteria bacterium]